MAPSSGSRRERLDLRGEVCPFTSARTRIALEALPSGGQLIVIVDHGPALQNIPRAARAWGHTVSSARQTSDGAWEMTLRKQDE